MSNTGSKSITKMFHYKHHAILIPEVMATDCILEATHHLTAAIKGIQEAALNELQSIESLHHILLGKQFPNNHAHHLLHIFMTLVLTKNQFIYGIQLPYNTRHKNRSRHFSFEFLLVKNCPFKKIKDLIPILKLTKIWNQVFYFLNIQFLTKRNSNEKWQEQFLCRVLYGSCTQTTSPSATTSSAPHTRHAIINNDDNAPPCPVPWVHSGCPAIIQDAMMHHQLSDTL
jgi:hypothetical protein